MPRTEVIVELRIEEVELCVGQGWRGGASGGGDRGTESKNDEGE